MVYFTGYIYGKNGLKICPSLQKAAVQIYQISYNFYISLICAACQLRALYFTFWLFRKISERDYKLRYNNPSVCMEKLGFHVEIKCQLDTTDDSFLQILLLA